MLELKTEIIVALIFSLGVTILLAIIQVFQNAAHKEKRDHDLKFLKQALAVKLTEDSNKSAQSIAEKFQAMPIKLGGQSNGQVKSWFLLLLWLTAFFGFCGWAFSLIQPTLKLWPIVPGLAALICAVMSFVVCSEDNKRNQVKQQLLRGLTKYSKITPEKVPGGQAQGAIKPQSETIANTSSLVSRPPIVSKPKTPKQFIVPEDSTLKRHYLAMLRTEVESNLPPKPTDFNLLRHYETMVSVEMDQRIGE